MNWKIFLCTLVAVPVLDFIFLGYIAKPFYAAHMAPVGRMVDGQIKPVYWAAVAVYLVIAFGMTYFAGARIEQAETWWQAAMVGAALGFVIYGTYDFTNHATLKSWPVPLLIADITWGAVVCGASAAISRVALN